MAKSQGIEVKPRPGSTIGGAVLQAHNLAVRTGVSVTVRWGRGWIIVSPTSNCKALVAALTAALDSQPACVAIRLGP
jgi:hypothetical protein